MRALIVVDPQVDFFDGGNLEVKGSESIIPNINKLTKCDFFDIVVLTKDWHPSNHKSFASQHDGKNVFDVIDLNGIDQVLWPDHCIQETNGSEFHPNIDMNINNLFLFKKGMDTEVDSYSAFYDNQRINSTGLTDFLKEKGIIDVYIAGLAADFCVKFTVLDSIQDGFYTNLILDATKGISSDINPHIKEMSDNGCRLTYTDTIV